MVQARTGVGAARASCLRTCRQTSIRHPSGWRPAVCAFPPTAISEAVW